jgi:hypothetical protein
VAIVQQPLANMGADEARAAGDQKIHGRTLTIGRQAVECPGKQNNYEQSGKLKHQGVFSLSPNSVGGEGEKH